MCSRCLVYFLYISFQGIFEHFSVFSYTPMVAGAIHVRTGRNAIGLAQNLDLFAASPKRFFLLPPCGPFCCPRLPLAGSVVWGRPLLFSFLFPSRFSSPLLVGQFTLSRRRFASTSRQWATILAQVLANSYLTKVESSLQRVSLKRQPAQGPAA